jgi:hypothetical protein
MKLVIYPKEINRKTVFYIGYVLLVSALYFLIKPVFESFMSTYMRSEDDLLLYSDWAMGFGLFLAWFLFSLIYWLDLNLTPEKRDQTSSVFIRNLPLAPYLLIVPCGYLALEISNYDSWFEFTLGRWPVFLTIVIAACIFGFAAKKKKSERAIN